MNSVVFSPGANPLKVVSPWERDLSNSRTRLGSRSEVIFR